MNEAHAVLLVSCHAATVAATVRALSEAGYPVRQASDGAQALLRVRETRPDLLLLDVMVASPAGLEVLRQIKADPTLDDVHVVLLGTPETDKLRAEAGLDAGADGFIASPFSDHELLARIRAHLRRHRHLSALRASEARLRAILEGEPDCVMLVGQDGGLLEMNAAGLGMFQVEDASALLGRPVIGLVHPEDQPAFQDLHRRVISGEAGRLQFRATGLRGRQRWMATHSTPLRAADGRVLSVLSVTRDVTETRAAREQLAQSTSLLSIAGRVARLGGWSLTLPDYALVWSDEIRAIHEVPAGFQPDVAQALQFYLPDYREEVARSVEACTRDGRAFDVEARIVTSGGREVWVRAIGEAVRDTDGRIVRVQGALQDISDQKASAAQIRSLDTRLVDTLESITDAFILLDRNWRFLYLNVETERLLQRHRGDLLGRDMWDEFPDAVGTSFQRNYQQAIDQNTPVAFEEFYPRLDKWLEVKAYPTPEGLAIYFRDVTEVRQSRDALRERERELRALADSMPQMVWVTGADGAGLYYNQRWVEYTGLSVELSCGYGWIAAFHPDDRQRAQQAWQLAVSSIGEYSIECRLRRVDGSYRWMLIRGLPYRDQTGRVIKWMGTCTDIDDLRIAIEQVAQSTQLVRLAGKMARVGGWSISVADQAVSWSDEVFAIIGLPAGESPPLQWALNLYPPQWRDSIEQALHFCQTEGRSFDLECELNGADGQSRCVRLVGEAARDDEGRIVRIQGALQDLTQIKQAEAAMRESAERFRLVARASKEAIWDWNLIDDSVWWSEGLERLFGYAAGEMERDSSGWKSRIHPSDQARVVATIHSAIDAASEEWIERYRFLRKDGKWAQVDDRGYLIRDAQGRVTRMLGSMSDISERLQVEEQLRQSQRLEAVGQLTGGVAHDFNNLLTVIVGNAELLVERASTDAGQRALAETVLEAAQRGAELTQRLLAFARKQALDPRVTDINQLVANLDRLLRRALGEHVEIEFIRGTGVWPALIDPVQLESALLNLSLNARDAMPGGGRLTLETANVTLDSAYANHHADLRPGDYVMLAASDTGVGIAPEHLQRVFEPFFTTKPKGKGTGLGMAMVYGFVKQSGGHVVLYSEPGQGTCVKLYLPRAVVPAQPTHGGNDERVLIGGSETILLVEDDEFVRQYAHGQLRALGYKVQAVENGQRALEVLSTGVAIDLLFTDVVMPGISGRQLADEARVLRPGLKVLYTSGYAENAIVHHGRLDAGVLLLSKPYRRSQLARKLREALGAS